MPATAPSSGSPLGGHQFSPGSVDSHNPAIQSDSCNAAPPTTAESRVRRGRRRVVARRRQSQTRPSPPALRGEAAAEVAAGGRAGGRSSSGDPGWREAVHWLRNHGGRAPRALHQHRGTFAAGHRRGAHQPAGKERAVVSRYDERECAAFNQTPSSSGAGSRDLVWGWRAEVERDIGQLCRRARRRRADACASQASTRPASAGYHDIFYYQPNGKLIARADEDAEVAALHRSPHETPIPAPAPPSSERERSTAPRASAEASTSTCGLARRAASVRCSFDGWLSRQHAAAHRGLGSSADEVGISA